MPLAQAVDDRLELSGFHSGTTSLDLVKADSQDSMARRFAGRRPPICGGCRLGEHVSHEAHKQRSGTSLWEV